MGILSGDSTFLKTQRRRRDIFVETQRQEFQAPSGATSNAYAAPDGAFSFCEFVFYNYAAPPALSQSAALWHGDKTSWPEPDRE